MTSRVRTAPAVKIMNLASSIASVLQATGAFTVDRTQVRKFRFYIQVSECPYGIVIVHKANLLMLRRNMYQGHKW